MSEKLARKLHEWYLEAITHLSGENFNTSADRPYDDLNEEQKSIDRYIANKIKALAKVDRDKLVDIIQKTNGNTLDRIDCFNLARAIAEGDVIQWE